MNGFHFFLIKLSGVHKFIHRFQILVPKINHKRYKYTYKYKRYKVAI